MSENAADGNALPPPENIKSFDNQVFITARWLAARFKIDYPLLLQVIDQNEALLGEGSMVYRDGHNVWIGDAAFIEIYHHPAVESCFDESARMSVLQLLGHYRTGQGR